MTGLKPDACRSDHQRAVKTHASFSALFYKFLPTTQLPRSNFLLPQIFASLPSHKSTMEYQQHPRANGDIKGTHALFQPPRFPPRTTLHRRVGRVASPFDCFTLLMELSEAVERVWGIPLFFCLLLCHYLSPQHCNQRIQTCCPCPDKHADNDSSVFRWPSIKRYLLDNKQATFAPARQVIPS